MDKIDREVDVEPGIHIGANGSSKMIKVASLVSGLLLAVAVHTGTLIWVLSSIQTTVAHMSSEITSLKQKLDEFTKERYTASDAARDQVFLLREMTALEQRVSRIENRLETSTKKPAE